MKKTRPEKCTGGCDRTFVSRPDEIEDPETQATHYGKGLCAGCKYRTTKPGTIMTRRRMPERCERCNRPMRGARTVAKEDGKVPYAGDGICRSCWMKLDRYFDKLLAALGMV